ncbi:MAG: hypothetical protein M0Z85_08940 [Gammaproteobacteria bacterium]|nr:hypothetical protein [Gammaproteobacteria bacterium]
MVAFERVRYAKLNPRQKENYNFQRVSGVLAKYGFVTMRLSDDWQGADFLAQHIDGETLLRVQLKSRFAIAKKYMGKGLYICFRRKNVWYMYPHDTLVEWALKHTNIGNTGSWKRQELYSVPKPSQALAGKLEQYRLEPDAQQ